MTTVAILQPSVFPWLGVFEQIHRSDIFVFYDDVAFDKHGWRNRNRIKTPNGWQWLTVPVLHRGRFGQLICDVEINNRVNWRERHLRALSQNYSRAPHFGDVFPHLKDFYLHSWGMLEEMAEESIKLACQLLGMERTFVCSKKLAIKGERSERLLRICQHFGATHYYSGAAARNYLDLDLFTRAGISVDFQDYRHPTYPQLYGEFISHLSILDLLFNVGKGSLETILEGANAGADNRRGRFHRETPDKALPGQGPHRYLLRYGHGASSLRQRR